MIDTQAARPPHLGSRVFSGIGAGWFTGVMGTGILAICLTIAPVAIPLGHAAGAVLWALDAIVFAGLCLIWALRAALRFKLVVATLSDSVQAQLWGAPPMACFTIAVGALVIGRHFLPPAACVAAAQALWIAGVCGSVFSAFVVPYLMFTQHEITVETTFGSWLLPVVPPIVASVPAGLLSATWPQAIRGDMLALAYALLGIGIALAACIIVIFYGRLLYQKVPNGAPVTTMWLVVGPLGQSIAGFIALGTAAKTVWPDLGPGLAIAALAYGVLVWGFSMYWLAMAVAMTIRATRKGLPFTLGWWAFTFPVGVLTAGTDALYNQTHAHLFAIASVLLVVLLATLWTLVAAKTLRTALA